MDVNKVSMLSILILQYQVSIYELSF